MKPIFNSILSFNTRYKNLLRVMLFSFVQARNKFGPAQSHLSGKMRRPYTVGSARPYKSFSDSCCTAAVIACPGPLSTQATGCSGGNIMKQDGFKARPRFRKKIYFFLRPSTNSRRREISLADGTLCHRPPCGESAARCNTQDTRRTQAGRYAGRTKAPLFHCKTFYRDGDHCLRYFFISKHVTLAGAGSIKQNAVVSVAFPLVHHVAPSLQLAVIRAAISSGRHVCMTWARRPFRSGERSLLKSRVFLFMQDARASVFPPGAAHKSSTSAASATGRHKAAQTLAGSRKYDSCPPGDSLTYRVPPQRDCLSRGHREPKSSV